MVYNPDLGLKIADAVCLAVYFGYLQYVVFIIFKYLIPLRIKSPYILSFYVVLTIMLICMCTMITMRLIFNDPGFIVDKNQRHTLGELCLHIQSVAYIVLGFIISATMF